MPMTDIGTIIAICKNLPETSANRAETAQEAAEAAAQVTATHNYGITDDGTGLSISEPGVNE